MLGMKQATTATLIFWLRWTIVIFVQMVLDLEAMLNTKVDLVTTDSLSKYLHPIVDKEKKLIYERVA
jgi:predicted nucleotidyltransferase